MGGGVHPLEVRRHRDADAVGRQGARARRGSGVDRSRERADRPRLQPFRRPAARAARPLGDRPVRAHRQGRLGVRARHHRRQGPALHHAQGRTAPRRGERAAGQSPFRVRRRGGDRRHDDRRLDRAGRARRRRGRHLRRRHDPHRHAGLQPRDARLDQLRPRGDDGRARPPLGDVRRRGAQRRPRLAQVLLGGARGRERAAARAAARRDRPADGRGARRAGSSCRRAPTSSSSRAPESSTRMRRSSSTSARSRSRPPT